MSQLLLLGGPLGAPVDPDAVLHHVLPLDVVVVQPRLAWVNVQVEGPKSAEFG
ncbi:hypothetical protein BQ8420_16615 [Nocardiopsis sp. JB363]|nr:hypothetical protein BQ8420_16615 [Nocardiopsis sp. JB363]